MRVAAGKRVRGQARARQDGAAGLSGRSVRVAGDAAHLAWVAGCCPAEPHTEVADHDGCYARDGGAGRA